MDFVIILIALGLERYLHASDYFYRFEWFDAYLDLMRGQLKKIGLFDGIVGVILLVLPILIAVAIVYYLLHGLLYHFVGFVLSLLILIYCIGPGDLYEELENYFVAKVQKNEKDIHENAKAISTDENAKDRDLSKALFSEFNGRIFAVTFWFVLLGPLGAVLYRCINLIHEKSKISESENQVLNKAAKLLEDILDWVPIRLITLGFALVGNFGHGFAFWLRHIGSGLGFNQEFLQSSGLKALDLNEENADKADVDEVKNALALTDRTAILYLVVVAILVLGSFIY